jgi:ATP-binding cassette subfamily B protein
MARSNRAGPLMETLGGMAITLVVIYGGHRVSSAGVARHLLHVHRGVSARLQPAKRLAKLNLDLSNGLVGVRVLFGSSTRRRRSRSTTRRRRSP